MTTYLQERMKKAKADDGFTLIELLIVVIILGILAAVVIFSISGVNDDAQTAACRTDKRILATAEEAHFVENDAYASENALFLAGYIDKESDLHDITLTATGYTVDDVAPCP